MKQKTAVLSALLVAMLNGCAGEAFNEPIPAASAISNLEATTQANEDLQEPDPNAARLWFHVRNEQQQQFIESLGHQLKLDNNIVIEPVQLVEAGPRKTQLRFFTPQDKERAKDLFKKFKKFFPKLQLLDLSYEYGASMTPGHFELWLAPNLQPPSLPPSKDSSAAAQGKPSVSVTKP